MLATLRRRRAYFLLKLRLLSEPQLVVASVPVVGNPNTPPDELRPLIPQRTEALVLVSAVHDGTIRAINYARSLRCAETRALFVALDPDEVEPITRAWQEHRIPVQLDIVDAPFRELGVPIVEEVRQGDRAGRTRWPLWSSPRSSCPAGGSICSTVSGPYT